jgi:hypothetical protein
MQSVKLITRVFTYIYVDFMIWEDLSGWFLPRRESVEFKVSTVPFDGIKRRIFQVVLAQEGSVTALLYGGRKHKQTHVLQTVPICKVEIITLLKMIKTTKLHSEMSFFLYNLFIYYVGLQFISNEIWVYK